MTTAPSANGLRVGDVVVMQNGPNVPRWLVVRHLDSGRVRLAAYDRGASGTLTVGHRSCRRVLPHDPARALLAQSIGGRP